MNKHFADENMEDVHDIAPAFSDEALALRFAEGQLQRMRYVAEWSQC